MKFTYVPSFSIAFAFLGWDSVGSSSSSSFPFFHRIFLKRPVHVQSAYIETRENYMSLGIEMYESERSRVNDERYI